MRKLHTLTLVLAACLLPVLSACEREEPSIALDNTSLVLPENGGSVTLNVTTNGFVVGSLAASLADFRQERSLYPHDQGR